MQEKTPKQKWSFTFKGSREEAFAQKKLQVEPPDMVLFPTAAKCSLLLCRRILVSEFSLRLMQTWLASSGWEQKGALPVCVASASLGVWEHNIPPHLFSLHFLAWCEPGPVKQLVCRNLSEQALTEWEQSCADLWHCSSCSKACFEVCAGTKSSSKELPSRHVR